MADAAPGQLIGAASALQDSRPGLRFTLPDGRPGIAVRFRGQVYAYVNTCAHVPVELDLVAGDVFDISGQYLVCAMHGAYYDPQTGRCLGGPCPGRRLTPLTVIERDGQVWLASA
ncbi:Rieske (2Fe-2S) protein [Rivihabitans pingtungensis]|uniref:Rieske (2Fe-2S) protein n=1 Tax=Rivihabitans pingtungensis TaxID=1054498 RepID=UPI002CF8AC9D|nr:Rieske 2Fe-2S domain-containing protein [Rivihabitans pingtungensis]HNX70365.1 Rieske 2Fe-2S domain-containing protein [Rivihabitans pingtungensis]